MRIAQPTRSEWGQCLFRHAWCPGFSRSPFQPHQFGPSSFSLHSPRFTTSQLQSYLRPEAQAILNELLEKYAADGELQFTLPDVLKVPPISQHGSVGEIVDVFGGPDELRSA